MDLKPLLYETMHSFSVWLKTGSNWAGINCVRSHTRKKILYYSIAEPLPAGVRSGYSNFLLEKSVEIIYVNI